MLSIKINNVEFSVKPGISILEVCKYVGVTVPRFCYHELLSIAGNCRMCLVEVEPFEKPVASCVAEIEEGMSIRLDTPFVKKARENVMEILLLNHPLDCPICDQAGECDLQDQAKVFGGTFSRNFFNRKGVEDKYCGPLIKTIMTRCISCTRCVRFGAEIAGVDYFGTLNRGGATEIGNYIQKMFLSEISGNVIDLCPVGALTARPQAFKARPWELKVVETIDTSDSLGSNIYVNFKETEIIRILPKSNNEKILSTIISDRTRFSYDSINKNRITNLYQYSQNTQKYKKVNWESTLKDIDSLVKNYNKNISFFIDEEIDLESLLHIKHLKFSNNYKINIITNAPYEFTNLYISSKNSLKDSIDKIDKLVLLIGTNLKSENAVLNAKIKIQQSKQYINVFQCAVSVKDNLSSTFIHFSAPKIFNIFQGKSSTLCQNFIKSLNILTIFGSSFKYKVTDYISLLGNLDRIPANINSLALTNFSNSSGFNWANISSNKESNEQSLFIGSNLSDIYFSRYFFNKDVRNNSIWINSHGSKTASNNSYILPSKVNFEVENFFLNQEGIFQKTSSVVPSPTESRSLSKILQVMFKEGYNYHYYSHMFEQAKKKIINKAKSISLFKKINTKCLGISLISTYPIKILHKNSFLFNNISKNSTLMLNSFEEYKQLEANFS